MRNSKQDKKQALQSPILHDCLAGFPKATITQLEEALEERVECRRQDEADTFPLNRDRRMLDRRRTEEDSWLCSGDHDESTENVAS